MRTVRRGARYAIPDSVEHEWQYFRWVFWKINRFFVLYTGMSFLFFVALGVVLAEPVLPLVGALGLEIFYVSIAWHEASHFGMARVLGIRAVEFTVAATQFEMRTGFDASAPIAAQDRVVVTSAGAAVPLLVLVPTAMVLAGLRVPWPALYAVFLLALIQILSIVPLGRSDGARIAAYLRSHPREKRLLLAMPVYYLYLLPGRQVIKGDES